jgi:hypothetical protein
LASKSFAAERRQIAGFGPGFAASTAARVKYLTHSLPLVSASRLVHLCRSRPRGSIRCAWMIMAGHGANAGSRLNI